MKVVHVVKNFPVLSETFVSNHIAQCIQNGLDTYVLADVMEQDLKVWNTSSNALIKKQAGLKSIRTRQVFTRFSKLTHLFKLTVINIKMLPFFLKSRDKKYGVLGSSFKLWEMIPAFYNLRAVDVFHSHFGPIGELTAIMKDLGVIKSKTVISFYGYDTFSSPTYQSQLENSYHFLKTNTDAYICNSKYLKKNLSNLNIKKSKISVHHVGIDPFVFKEVKRVQTATFKMVCVGRLIKLKGQHIAIEAMHLLKNNSLELHLLGDGEEMEQLQKLISEYRLKEQVFLHGKAIEKEIKMHLEQSDVFVMCSITDEHGRAEGQGLVTAEAQATGLPVIATNSGGIPETIIDGATGILVPENDVAALAQAILSLKNDRELFNTFSKNAVELIKEKFDQSKISKNIIEHYKN